MRRRLLVLALAWAGAGCLVPGASPLSAVDTERPRLLELRPALAPDAKGVLFMTLPAAAAIELTFSEPMDPSSLRPGIVVKTYEGAEQLLSIVAPDFQGGLADRDVPWTVKVRAAEGSFRSDNYLLVLRNLLLDAQGNPLALEQDAVEQFFAVYVQ